jgi:MoaA/NifB/PqqE/SkfB family radical SAM enzyme
MGIPAEMDHRTTKLGSLYRMLGFSFGQRWLSAENKGTARGDRQDDTCLGYGFSWLDNEGSETSRWSRRFFGFYLNLEGIREITLVFDSPLATTLTFFVDAKRIEVRKLTPGRQSARFVLLPRRNNSAARHVGFALGDTWQSTGDPRSLGIRLFGLHVRAGRRSVSYRAESFSHNSNKAYWLSCDDCFQVSRSGACDPELNVTLNVLERTAERERVAASPLKVYLEIAWLCNLRCPSCFQAYVPSALRKDAIHFMSPYIFREAAEKLFPGAAMVWYTGNGESLLHPNIETILGTAREFKFAPSLLTNGTMFTERNMRLLVEGGFSLCISVDSPYEQDFERLRAGARFSKLVAALEHLRELRRTVRNERFTLRIQCVAQQSNLHQLVDLVKWSAGYGVSEIQFLSIHNNGNFSDYIERSRLRHAAENANRQMLDALRAATELGIRVRAFPLIDPSASQAREFQAAVRENLASTFSIEVYYSRYYSPGLGTAQHPANNDLRQCELAWSECFVGADGRVAPCCVNLEKTMVGNLYDDDFWTIWNGPKMVTWRQTVNHDPRGICSFGNCIFRNEVPPSIAGVSQLGDMLTVTGSGFSDRTVINFFNLQNGAPVNLGGLGTDGARRIRVEVEGPNEITFIKPSEAVPGKAYVQVVNPPYGPLGSSGTGPSGEFTLR